MLCLRLGTSNGTMLATDDAGGVVVGEIVQGGRRDSLSPMRLIVLLLLACALGAADYHLSPSGDDANDGGADRPWRNVARVNRQALAAGDHVLFQGGQVFTDAGLQLHSDDVGSAVKPIVIGRPGDDPAAARPAWHQCLQHRRGAGP